MQSATAGRARAWIVAFAEGTATAVMAAALTYLPLASPTHGSSRTGRWALVATEPARADVGPRGMAIAEATLALAQRLLGDTVDIGSLEIEVDASGTVKVRVALERRDARSRPESGPRASQ
jgi:hypothetical protein